MTLAELRALKPSTIQERYQIEVAAQVAELNENFKEFLKTQPPTMHYNINVTAPSGTDTEKIGKEVRKALERTPVGRTPLVEK